MQILGSSAVVLHSNSALPNTMSGQVDNPWPSGADIRFFSWSSYSSSALPNYMSKQEDNPRPSGADIRFSVVVLHSSSALPNYIPKQVDNPWPSGADIRFYSCSSSQLHSSAQLHA